MCKVIGKWRQTWKCALCGEEHEGWGSNPAPLMDYNSALVCEDCNQKVIAFRLLLLQYGFDIYDTIDRKMYNRIKRYARKNIEVRPYAKYLDEFFKGTDIDKITDPVDYGDLVEEDELSGEEESA